MGLLKDQDVLHFKDVLQLFSLLHAPKPCRGSVKLFHLMSWNFPTAELCHPCEGQVYPLSSLAKSVGCMGGSPGSQAAVTPLLLSSRHAREQGLARACVDYVKCKFLLKLLPHAQVEWKPGALLSVRNVFYSFSPDPIYTRSYTTHNGLWPPKLWLCCVVTSL